MSFVAVSLPTYTEDEYLEIDRAAEVRSEYHDGVIVAMSGGSVWHSLIPANLIVGLSPGLRERGCLAYSSDLRIKIGKARSFVYPDLSVICGAPRFVFAVG